MSKTVAKICSRGRDGIDTDTPIGLLQSAGVLKSTLLPERGDSEDIVQRVKRAGGFGATVASVWSNRGDVCVSYSSDVIDIKPKTVVGPPDVESFFAADMVAHPVRYWHSGLVQFCLLVGDREQRTMDVCVYDPSETAESDDLHAIAGFLGAWMRALLGDGWGLRVEVHHHSSLCDECRDLSPVWTTMLLLIKGYVPHLRMADIDAAWRCDCRSRGVTTRAALQQIAQGLLDFEA